MNKIDIEVRGRSQYYPLEMTLDHALEEGIELAQQGQFGKIALLYSDLDEPQSVDEWIDMKKMFDYPNINYVKIDCTKLPIEHPINLVTGTIDCYHCFDKTMIEKLSKDNTIIFLENYCLCEKYIRNQLVDMVRNGIVKYYQPVDFLTVQQIEDYVGEVQLPPAPLVIIHVDFEKVQEIETINEFEKLMLGLEIQEDL